MAVPKGARNAWQMPLVDMTKIAWIASNRRRVPTEPLALRIQSDTDPTQSDTGCFVQELHVRERFTHQPGMGTVTGMNHLGLIRPKSVRR